jgi:hypothetical protein
MPKSIWRFLIEYDEFGNEPGSTGIGIRARTSFELEEMARDSGFVLTTSYSTPKLGCVRMLQVSEPEDSPRLARLLIEIRNRFGLEPSPTSAIPESLRGRFFGVRKERKYTISELDQCELLYLHSGIRSIANHCDGDHLQVSQETYVAESGTTNKRCRFGSLSPFRALAVSGDLKKELEDECLAKIYFEPVVNGDDIWKLSSEMVLPRCKLPLVGGDGLPIDDINTWSRNAGWRWFDDHGYDPQELVYDRRDIESLGPFDIAVTSERTGITESRAVRWCVVSQRFRSLLKSLKVSQATYAPVRLV